MTISDLAKQIKPYVQRWIDGAILGGDRNLGTVGNPYNTVYADTVTADTIIGTMTGSEWETAGNATIDANQASATTVVYVVNQASSGTANLDVEGSIIVGGNVDGVDVSAHAASVNAHHAQAHVLATTSGLGPDHTTSGLTSGQVLRASGATTALFGNLSHGEVAGITADQHHAQAHVLATNTALGADHTVSGATAGHVLRASSATAAAFSQLAHTELSSIGTNTHAQIDTHIAATGTAVHGLGTMSTQAASAVAITGGTITGITDLAVADGGTGASTAAAAATNLGLGTGDSPQFAAINLGHATDTTIARVSAGLISVEGDTVALLTAAQTLTNKTLTTPTIASFVNAAHTHADAAGGGLVSHTDLSNVVADEHIAHSSITFTAGAGLTGGGTLAASRTFTVGAGTLITVGTDDVGITPGSAYQFVGTGAGTVAAWQNLSTLAGSGIAYASGVLSVTPGTLITVGADNVSLSVGTAQYQVPVTGATPFTPAYTLLSTFAGIGLTWASGTYTVGTPTTLTVSSTNSVSGTTHNHAVTSSSNPGAAASLLATDASGYLTLVRLKTDTLADKSGANLTISPAGDIVLDPTGNDVLPNSNYDINLGSISKKYLTLHAAELWVETLVAQETIATIGGRVLIGQTTTLTSDISAGATTIYTKHNSLRNGDIVYLEANGSVEFMQITSNPTGTGPYTYTATRNLDGTGAGAWYAGDAVFNTGTTGNGFIDLYSLWSITGRNLSYIYNYDAGGATYSVDYSSNNSWSVFGDSANSAVNDAIYFGLTGTTWNNLFFNVVTAGVYTATLVWEYWNGTAWTSFTPTATTDFKTIGAASVTWTSLASWASTTVNGQAAYWVRVRISAWTSWTTLPIQGDRRVRAVEKQWGPTIVGNVRGSTTWNDWTERWAIGNLDGLYDYGVDTYGVAFGVPSATWLAMDATNGLRITNGSTQVGRWDTSGNVTVGDAAGENIYITAAGVYLRAAAVAYTSLVGTTLTLGLSTTEHVSITSTGVQIKDGATVYTDLTAGVLSVGEVGASKSNVYIAAGGVQLRNNTTKKIDLQSDGDVFIGTDTSAAATTTLAVFSTSQTYNGETMDVGDLLLGDSTAGKANIWWDKSAGLLYFRGGTTAGAYINTVGTIVAGAGTVTLDANGIDIAANTLATFSNPYAVSWMSGATLVGSIDARDVAGINYVYLKSDPIAAKSSEVIVQATAPSSGSVAATVRLETWRATQGGTITAGMTNANVAYASLSTPTGGVNVTDDTVQITGPSGINVTGVVTLSNTGLHLFDTNASHDLIIAPGSDLTADRTLTLTTGDVARTLTLTGNATLNQDVSSAGSPTFAATTVPIQYGTRYATWTAVSGASGVLTDGVCYVNIGDIAYLGNVTIEVTGGFSTGQAFGRIVRSFSFYHALGGTSFTNLATATLEASGQAGATIAIGDIELNSASMRIPIYKITDSHNITVAVRVMVQSITTANVTDMIAELSLAAWAEVTNSQTRQYPYTNERFGIKQSAPTYDLDITGTLRATGAAYLTDIRPVSDSTTAVQLKRSGGTAIVTVDTTNSRVGINGTPGAFAFDVTGTANVSSMLKGLDIWASASLGVGVQPTDPSWQVDVVGASRFTGAITVTGIVTLPTGGSVTAPTLTFSGDTNTGIYRSAADKVQIAANGQAAATFDGTSGAGRVGIGTDSPSYGLHVVPAAYFDGDVTVNGNIFPTGYVAKQRTWNQSIAGSGNWSTGITIGTSQFYIIHVVFMSTSDGSIVGLSTWQCARTGSANRVDLVWGTSTDHSVTLNTNVITINNANASTRYASVSLLRTM